MRLHCLNVCHGSWLCRADYRMQAALFNHDRIIWITAASIERKLKRAAIIQITARNRSSSCAAVHCSRLQLLKFAQQCPEIRRFACTRHIAGLRATTITYGRGFEYVVQLLHIAAFEERTFCRIKVPVVLCKGQCYRAATAIQQFQYWQLLHVEFAVRMSNTGIVTSSRYLLLLSRRCNGVTFALPKLIPILANVPEV